MALNTLRPIRPKPLIATLIAMDSSPYLIKLFLSFVFRVCHFKQRRIICPARLNQRFHLLRDILCCEAKIFKCFFGRGGLAKSIKPYDSAFQSNVL